MKIRRNENSKNIKGVLPMSEARIKIQNIVFEFLTESIFKIILYFLYLLIISV